MALDHVKHVEACALLRRLLEHGAGTLPAGMETTTIGWLQENHPPPEAYVAAMGALADLPEHIANLPGPTASFLYRWHRAGVHVNASVFAGPDEQHRANLGSLTFRPAEFDAFRARVEGPGHTFEEREMTPT